MRQFIITIVLSSILLINNLKSQTWTNYSDPTGFSFDFPTNAANRFDTLGQVIYHHAIDTTIYFSSIHISNGEVKNIPMMDSVIIQEGNDTLRALMKITGFVNGSDIESAQDIQYINSAGIIYHGLETTLVSQHDYYGGKKMLSFFQMYKNGKEVYIFSVIGLDDNLTLLRNYKDLLFTSISIN